MHTLMLAGWKHWQTIKWMVAQSVWEPKSCCFEFRVMKNGQEQVCSFKERGTFARSQLEQWFTHVINDGSEVCFIKRKILWPLVGQK